MVANNSQHFIDNFLKILELYQKILLKMATKQTCIQNKSQIDPLNLQEIIIKFCTKLVQEPEILYNSQLYLTENYLKLAQTTFERLMGDGNQQNTPTATKDKRFSESSWEQHPFFDFIRQSYLLNTAWLSGIVKNADDFDQKTSMKLNFLIRQIIDALSPSNFLMTNPTVLKETLQSNGDNIVRGLTNFLADLEQEKHLLHIKTSNDAKFSLGENIANTKGKVVFQNEMIQLIHYQPITEKNFQLPLLIIPPWINKFYVFDLSEKNSYVKWLVENGYSVFIISWINPDKRHAHKDFASYMSEGVLASLDAITSLTKQIEVNAIGYCIGGTLLTVTLAYMATKGDTRINSATFFTTLVDFSNVGELAIFIDREQVAMIEQQMQLDGYFDGQDLAYAFNLLRSNDMIWSFMINNYLLGEDPLPFDLLYWNADSTRLPEAMYKYYLHNFYLDNLLIKPDALEINSVKIDISKITTPCYFLSAKDDFIVPWKSTYTATQILNSNCVFTLTASGHVGGVTNHPQNGKYCYFVGKTEFPDADAWFAGAEEHKGSWWTHWHDWQKSHAGPLLAGSKKNYASLPCLEAAPGSYVKKKYE